MPIPFIQRLQAAAGMILRGSVAPFDRVFSDAGLLTGERIREPYRQSVWVHAAIKHIARPCAAVSLRHSEGRRRKGTATTLVEDERLENFWERPARCFNSWAEFLLATITWRKLAGESFWLLSDGSAVPFPEVQASFPPLILARPDRMRHVTDGNEIIGWQYTDGAGRGHYLLPEQVIHLRQQNPYDDHRGLGDWEVAQLAAETDRASATFARNLAQSNGDQGVYVVAKNGVPDDAQKAQITNLLREKRRLQQAGIFRPVFLTGDITVEDPKVRAVDAAFIESRRMSAAEIFVAFGIPPSMAKEQASYSIGGASDYFRLILDACIPESAEIAAGVSRVSSILTGRDLSAWFGWDEHPVLQEVRKERMQTVDGLWAKGMPLAKISDYLDLGIPRFKGDDQGWLPMSVVPADSAADLALDPGPEGGASPADKPPAPGDKPTPADPQSPDPVQEALRALQVRHVDKRSPSDHQLWSRHMRDRMPTVRAYSAAFTRQLMEARRQVLRKLDARASKMPQDDLGPMDGAHGGSDAPRANVSVRQGEILGRSGAIDLMFDRDEFEKGLFLGFRRVSDDALTTAGKQLFKELGKDDPFTYPPERALQFFAGRENKLAEIADDVFEAIKGELEDGLNAGDSIKDLAARVKGAFNEMSSGRAKRIAMTETAAAYGVARQEAMDQAGVRYKRWLTSGGDNVRPAHMEANNQTVPVDDAFDVGGEQLMHPGDPSGAPGNIINCHCVSIAVADPDEGLNP